jgi:hypothetical protein
MHNKIITEINIYDVKLEVSGTYYPSEAMIMYDDNMEGYPGSYAEFEIRSVKVEGIDITKLISDDVNDQIIEKIIKNQEN